MSIMVLCGSKSDLHIVEGTKQILDENNIKYKIEVASAHRDPERVHKIVKESEADVFIATAGLAAALPGVVASLTDKPVIGVPVSAKLNGLDALLSIVQMPPGIPVACVGIDNGKNAAHLAIRILKLKGRI